MKLKKGIKKALKVILRPGSLRFKAARSIAQKIGLIGPIPRDVRYLEWIERTEPYSWSEPGMLKINPKVSIVVPVFNPPEKYFLPMVYSVIGQSYSNWELILVNASTDKKCRRQTEAAKNIDERIVVLNLKSNEGIAANTNAGLEQASGEWIALLDHDDLIAPGALYEMLLGLQESPDAGMIYSDEDKVTADGEERFDPHIKPDWSPQIMRHVNYLNHFSLIRKSILKKVGGFREGYEGAQDFDLYLRVTDASANVAHIQKVLYHWRAAETSTARSFSLKENILDAGVRAVSEHLDRKKVKGSVSALKKQPGYYEVDYDWNDNDSVAVIIMPMVSGAQHMKLLAQVLKDADSTRGSVEVISKSPAESVTVGTNGAKVIYIDEDSQTDFLKAAYKASDAKIFIILGSALVPTSQDWITRLASQLARDDEVGLAAPLIFSSNKQIVDGGLVRYGDGYIDIFKGYIKGQHTYFGNVSWPRNLDSISGRCYVLRREDIPSIEGCYKTKGFDSSRLEKGIGSKQICLNSSVKMLYAGESTLPRHASHYFSPLLAHATTEFSVTKMANIPESKYEE